MAEGDKKQQKKVYPNMLAPGRELVRLREERSLSQRDAANMAGVGTFQQLASLEKGLVENPSMMHLVAYGKLYGKTPNEIAELYGYWEDFAKEESGYLTILRDLTNNLPPDQRDRALFDYVRDANKRFRELLAKS